MKRKAFEKIKYINDNILYNVKTIIEEELSQSLLFVRKNTLY